MKDGIIQFHAKGFPQTKGSVKGFTRRDSNRVFLTNDNVKNKDWEKVVRVMAQCVAPEEGPWSGPVELNLHFYLRKPKSHPKTRYVFHTKRPDLDKITRSVKDALTGVVYLDDSQVCCGYRRKEYGDIPGVEIEARNLLIVERRYE